MRNALHSRHILRTPTKSYSFNHHNRAQVKEKRDPSHIESQCGNYRHVSPDAKF